MPLPLCECVNGLPTQQQLGFIYCALLEILAGQGGDITLSQISDLDGSWITPLQTPITTFGVDVISNPAIGASSGYLTVNTDDAVTVVPFASISIAASQISDATATAIGLLTTLPGGDPSGSYVIVDDVNSANVINNNFSGSGLTTVDVTDGLVTNGT